MSTVSYCRILNRPDHSMSKTIKSAGIIVVCYLVLATTVTRGQVHEQYIGCFVDNINDQQWEPVLKNQSDLTIEICIQKCHNATNRIQSETTFAALANGRECICRNNSGQELRDRNCNVKCFGDQMQNCGGSTQSRFYSLYSVCRIGYFGPKCNTLCHCKRHLPCDRETGICPDGCKEQWTGTTCNISNIHKQFIGCYADGRDHAWPWAMDVKNPGGKTGYWKQDNNSIEFCIEICSTSKYTYAGMQYGYDCFCGEKYARFGNKTHYGRPVNCSFPCPANSSQICGGDLANSVYYVCPVGFYGRNCTNRCLCNGSPCRFNGSCLCKSGWTGSACNIRDCTINNGDCGSDELCESVDLGFANSSMCRCKNGSFRDNNTCRLICRVGYFGQKCDQLCHCKRHLPCDRKTGICPDGCEEQWTGTSCNISNIQKQYIGCYGDGWPGEWAMDVKNPDGRTGVGKQRNSVEFCIEICSTGGFTYAGMQFGVDCHCGENYAKYGNITYFGVPVNCNYTCPANNSQTCGGYFANSVHYVCPVGFYGQNCTDRCLCNGSPCRFNGSCLCKSGWTGSACNIRDCENNTGDCGSDEMCESVDLGFANSSMCRCKNGSSRDNNTCYVDECKSGTLCSAISENCVNNNGSYVCVCKNGFTNASGNCEDVDECTSGVSACNETSENCINNFGSYRCICKDGFVNISGECEDVDECKSNILSCNTASENCLNNIGSYRCERKDGFGNLSGQCEEPKNTPAIGIIVWSFLAISLLINALFAVSKIKRVKSRNPGPGKEMAQSDLQPNSIYDVAQCEMNYNVTPVPVDQNNIYEQMVPANRRIKQIPNSEYAELKLDDYVDIGSSV